jgi:heme oxygenase (mycobilin-producing)
MPDGNQHAVAFKLKDFSSLSAFHFIQRWKGGAAMTKVLIRRMIPADAGPELEKLLRQMRSSTIERRGYVFGETLYRVDVPGEVLVISTWQTIQDWERWFQSPERMEIQTRIDVLLQTPTEYAIYDYA